MIKKLFILVILMTFGAYLFAQSDTVPDVISVIHSRKSVRNYTEQQVTKSQLETLVKAGMAAPSAMNKQPWFFVVIDDKDILKTLANKMMFGNMLNYASAAIVVCGDMRNVPDILPKFWVQDCSAASQNILLAAEGTGLGAVWIGVYPNKVAVKKVRELLNLPRHIVPLNIISIGYPDGTDRPKKKWDEKKMIWNSW
jgi:nitroreductase